MSGPANLTGDTKGYDPEHPEWLAMDLRQIADNTNARAGYATANAQILRIAAHQFDGLGGELTAEEARSHWRKVNAPSPTPSPTHETGGRDD